MEMSENQEYKKCSFDLNFLQDGTFEILPSNDKYLGGLFNLGG